MRLDGLTTKGFRGVSDGEYTWPKGSDLVVVTGPPACGKSSFLGAIIAAKELAAPYGAMRLPREYLRLGSRTATVSLAWSFEPAEAKYAGLTAASVTTETVFADPPARDTENDRDVLQLLSRFELEGDLGKLFFFPDRRAIGGLVVPIGREADSVRREALEDSARKFAPLSSFVRDACFGLLAKGTEDAFVRAFSALCDTKRFAGIGASGEARALLFQGAGLTRVYLNELSASEQQAFIFAATFLLAGLRRSIILIDSPELGLADDRVVPLVRALQGLAPDNQIIVATNSQALVNAVPPEARIVLRRSEASS